MAFPTAVNSQITDAVTQSNVETLGHTPALAAGSLYQAIAQSMGLAAQNAVNAQQQGHLLAQAATTRCVALLTGGQ